MELHTFKDGDALSHAVATWIVDAAAQTLKTQDRFTLVLSGGNTPKALFELLAVSPYREQIDWSRIHVFWGDERAVPFDDERNNAKMAFDTLLNHVGVPASQVHIMRTDIKPEESAREYEELLHRYFPAVGPGFTTFDLVLLGMGDDGHTLSLFPGTDVVFEENAWATAYFLKAQNMFRITLTKTIVNASARVAFLVTGEAKARALKEVMEGEFNPGLYPSQVIRPLNDELHWFVDEAAAANLE